ncbi:LCP family protein [Brevibacillus panacihumi]|uniref:LytR family transcriptional regulator n=1 Tax=Brevibacillus panacihumi TaxID=497735 RepID=A0A3M8CM17_9BACL|nr:LCP family protein [Brevibacillus panacihumi]RNB76714.1 LytR family transcriptional regulator [Brevibacillus panacihumi]
MKRLRLIIIGLLLLSLGGTTWYVYQLFERVQQTAKSIYEPLPPPPVPSVTAEKTEKPKPEEPKQEEAKRPLKLLLFGVDKRGNDPGRSDTLIFLAIHPGKKETLMFNIPRDTRTFIADSDKEDKINHAYSKGGIPATVRTVERFLDIPVDYYVKVEMEGFAAIVDSLGGIAVDNAFAFDYEGYHFPKGLIALDGEKALAYARMRYEDPEGDFGRNKRQQLILRELMSKAKQISTVGKMDDILANIGNSFKTNLTLNDMQELMLNYRSSLDHLEIQRLQGEGGMHQGVYYYFVSAQERLRIKQEIERFVGEPGPSVTIQAEKKETEGVGI